jgi:cytochrome c2
MPRYNFSLQERSDLAVYLIDEFTDYEILEEDADTPIPTFWESQEERSETGRRVYKELRCANCHSLLEQNHEWRKVGPELTFIGDKKISDINFGNSEIPRTIPDYLFEKVRNPQGFATPTNVTKMPKFDLSDEDIRDIVLALLSFNSDTLALKDYRSTSVDNETYEPAGEFGRLVHKYRCFSCHSFKGRGHNITYDLSFEGSRVQRDWLVNYLKFSYTIRPILTIRMPIFNMTDKDAEILADGILREMTDPDMENAVEITLTADMIDKGRSLVEERGCLACHQVGERGGYVGPSFTLGSFVGEKLQANWIFRWLKNPQALKPDVLEPRYGFSDDEALNITAYLMSIKKAEQLDSEVSNK